jgi:RNA polymerase sigma-70 factor (ECF subfamily)
LRNREDAEDAVQDAMLSAHRHIERFDGRSQMSTWITSIVINAVRMQIRRRSRRPTLSLDEGTQDSNRKVDEWPLDPRPTPEQSLLQRDLQLLVFDLIAHLPPVQREALRLRQQDLSIKQVAETFGIPVGTVKARLARARSELSRRFHQITDATKTQSPRAQSKATRNPHSFRPRAAERIPLVPIEVFQAQGVGENWIGA